MRPGSRNGRPFGGRSSRPGGSTPSSRKPPPSVDDSSIPEKPGKRTVCGIGRRDDDYSPASFDAEADKAAAGRLPLLCDTIIRVRHDAPSRSWTYRIDFRRVELFSETRITGEHWVVRLVERRRYFWIFPWQSSLDVYSLHALRLETVIRSFLATGHWPAESYL